MQQAILKQQHQQQLQGTDLANLTATITQQGIEAQGLMSLIQDQGSKMSLLATQVTTLTVSMEAIMEKLANLHTTMQALQSPQQQQQQQQQPQPPQQPQQTPSDASAAEQALITATAGDVVAEAATDTVTATGTVLPETNDDDLEAPYAPARKGKPTRSSPMGV